MHLHNNGAASTVERQNPAAAGHVHYILAAATARLSGRVARMCVADARPRTCRGRNTRDKARSWREGLRCTQPLSHAPHSIFCNIGEGKYAATPHRRCRVFTVQCRRHWQMPKGAAANAACRCTNQMSRAARDECWHLTLLTASL